MNYYIIAKDENIRKIMREMTDMADDCNKLQQILEIVVTLRSVIIMFIHSYFN